MDEEQNDYKVLKAYKGTEKPDDPNKMSRWAFNPFMRISMFGDLLARGDMSRPEKIKWALVLLFWPFGLSSYYYGVYSKKEPENYKTETMEKAKSLNKDANYIQFWLLVFGLIILLSFGVFIALSIK